MSWRKTKARISTNLPEALTVRACVCDESMICVHGGMEREKRKKIK
jgi:hypothetical protein